ncbi:sugar phosphate isomerase/epimerase [Humibacter sp. RRB41]|uniref:sugar phosphate isomerase/epimerase family protein n=1 Tax=Humibacter sp. RRB41 TaxID=2919946 RepID=UPI001FA9657F|nr:sugar phosphate isomerase/epimerase [Humibacter sp. RRB41]
MMLKQHVAAEGAYAVWKRLADHGFGVVEVSQIELTEATRDEIVRAGDDFGIVVAAISGGMGETGGGGNDSLRESFDKIVADCRALGTERVRIGMLPTPSLASKDALLAFIADANEMARRLADQGIVLSYHNHHAEFARIDGKHILDLIREGAPDLKLELDVHWIQRGGMDPVTVLERYSGAVDLVHLKDYRIELPSPEAFDALAGGDQTTWNAAWSALVQFAEVGRGNLDFAGVVDAGVAAGAEYLLIEQDEQYGRDIYDCLADSRAHLVGLGYGDMF